MKYKKYLLTSLFLLNTSLLLAAPKLKDTDHDGMPDKWEKANHLSLKKNDAKRDADKDSLSNLLEFKHKTDPNNSDTDSDELGDGDEVKIFGTDPTDADSDDNGDFDGEEDFNNDGNTNAKEHENHGGFVSDELGVKVHAEGFVTEISAYLITVADHVFYAPSEINISTLLVGDNVSIQATTLEGHLVIKKIEKRGAVNGGKDPNSDKGLEGKGVITAVTSNSVTINRKILFAPAGVSLLSFAVNDVVEFKYILVDTKPTLIKIRKVGGHSPNGTDNKGSDDNNSNNSNTTTGSGDNKGSGGGGQDSNTGVVKYDFKGVLTFVGVDSIKINDKLVSVPVGVSIHNLVVGDKVEGTVYKVGEKILLAAIRKVL